MASLFGGNKKQKPDPATQRSQRRQDQALSTQENEEQKELGARQRLIAARSQGRASSTLFAPTGAVGVKSTLGG